jgi:hypothetical protein
MDEAGFNQTRRIMIVLNGQKGEELSSTQSEDLPKLQRDVLLCNAVGKSADGTVNVTGCSTKNIGGISNSS